MNPWDELRKRVDFIPKLGFRCLERTYRFDALLKRIEENGQGAPPFKDVVEALTGCHDMSPEQWDKFRSEVGEIVSEMKAECRDQEFENMHNPPGEMTSKDDSRMPSLNMSPRQVALADHGAIPEHMPFLKEFEEGLRIGFICASARTRKYGNVGDRISAFGITFVIERLHYIPLEMVATHYFLMCGCESPKHYKKVWGRLHHRKGFDPKQRVWLHIFHKEEWT